MKERKVLGRWEVGCLVFHLCTARMAIAEQGTVPLWAVTLGSGVAALAVLAILLWFGKPQRTPCGGWFAVLSVCYWLFVGAETLKSGAEVLRLTAYPSAPVWYRTVFLLLGALVPTLCGLKSVGRMYALVTVPVLLLTAAVASVGIADAEAVQLLVPSSGGWGEAVRLGLSQVGWYADILFLRMLTPDCREEVTLNRTVFFAAAAAVAVNVGIAVVISIQPTIAAKLPLYAIAKNGVGTGLLYTMAFAASWMLRLAMALCLIAKGIGRLRKAVGRRRVGAFLLALMLCVTLSGCYDSREVEETAYIIGLGLDGGSDTLRYTFQISNPLKSTPQDAEGETKGNDGVVVASAESENLALALDDLRSSLGKEPNLSHLKVIVFSAETARSGLQKTAEELFGHREIRPDTRLCLAEGAEEFLRGVRPTLEESTARYYKLLFRPQYSPYAPICDLSELIAGIRTEGRDAVLPVSKDGQLVGMGIFCGGTLVRMADRAETTAYLLVCGEGKNLTVAVGDSVFAVTACGKPKRTAEEDGGMLHLTAVPKIRCRLLQGSAEDCGELAFYLQAEAERLLRVCAEESADILGFGAFVSNLRQREGTSWSERLKEASVTVQPRLILEKE